MKYLKTQYLNNKIETNTNELILNSEMEYKNQIFELCSEIIKTKEERPIILISGPSGSGKTSTAFEISNQLYKNNCDCHVISLDNYFKENTSPGMPLDENGDIDLESPYCTDLTLLNQHLHAIQKCEEFQMPIFNFQKQKRLEHVPFKRNKGSVVIMEGIHALNPDVTGESKDFSTCVYISVRTRLKSPENKMLHPRMIRLMRRLCRDCLFRGRSLYDVFYYFESVSRGEDKYILPHKHRATFNIDTFMSYEVPVYKSILFDKLTASKDNFINNKYYNNIINFLEILEPLNQNLIPKSSIIREFVGGGDNKY